MEFEIFDVKQSITADNVVVKANSQKHAVEKYLLQKGETNCKIAVSGGKDARISATPFYTKDGRRYLYHNKRTVWFAINTQFI